MVIVQGLFGLCYRFFDKFYRTDLKQLKKKIMSAMYKFLYEARVFVAGKLLKHIVTNTIAYYNSYITSQNDL